mmetsp:Transcript_20991/g.29633  ORF Transcript_20991/g.29633 Transcript_20991/m.29633 type:complete len:185 (+) Transcript_20991:188-742(+)
MADISQYKVGVIVSLEDCGSCKGKGGKALKACKIQIGPDESAELTTVVTSATNVREGSRIVVAPVGSSFIDNEGEERPVTKATVGGVVSEGMLCDSTMLGWTGGAKGIAVQVPEECAIGSAPPASKPRKGEQNNTAASDADKPLEGGLFERKLTKEEKKKIAEEKRKAKKAAKEAKKAAEAANK